MKIRFLGRAENSESSGSTEPEALTDATALARREMSKRRFFKMVAASAGAVGVGQLALAPRRAEAYTYNEDLIVNGTLKATGYVMFGHTIAPVSPLDVVGDNTSGIQVGGFWNKTAWVAGNWGRTYIDIGRISAAGTKTVLGRIEGTTESPTDSTYGYLAFHTRYANTMYERVHITSQGNVGIGTTAPAVRVHVSDPSSTSSGRIRVAADAAYGELVAYGSTYPTGHLTNQVGLIGQGYNLFLMANGASCDLRFYTGGSGTANERVRIDSAGKVGIGTPSPQALLNTSSNNTPAIRMTNTAGGGGNFEFRPYILGISNNGFSLRDINANADRLVVTSTGDVGLGTTNPDWKLDITSSSSGDGIRINGSSASSLSPGIRFADAGVAKGYLGLALVNSAWITGTVPGDTVLRSDSRLIFASGGSGRVYIDDDGKVGIGNSGPAYTLDVAGDTRINGGVLRMGSRVVADANGCYYA